MTEPGTRPDQTGPEQANTNYQADVEAWQLARMRRTSWLWVAASVVGVLGGVANYLLATRVVSAGVEPTIGAAALVAALLGLACWLLLALLWVTLQVPLRNDRGWARVALGVTSALGVGLDVIALAGSWATITAAALQFVLLVAALWQTFRPTPS